MTQRKIIARFAVTPQRHMVELVHSFHDNGVYEFPASVEQISGLCEYQESIIICDCGNKKDGKNKIFLLEDGGNLQEVILRTEYTTGW